MAAILRGIAKYPKRIGSYFYTRGANIGTDYWRTTKDVALRFKTQPISSSKNALIAGFILYSMASNPDFQEYKDQIFTNKMVMVDTGVNRSQRSNDYVQELERLERRKLLSVENFIIFSVVRKLNYSSSNCSPEAVFDRRPGRWYNPVTYYYSTPRFFRSIVDIGICGKFLKLEYELGGFPDSDEKDLVDNSLEETYRDSNAKALGSGQLLFENFSDSQSGRDHVAKVQSTLDLFLRRSKYSRKSIFAILR